MPPRTLLLAAAVCVVALAMGGALLPAFGGALGAWRAGSLALRALHALGSGEFVPVGGNADVRRLDLWWRPLPVLPLPLSAYLVRSEENGWALVDAGAPDSWSQSYATRLLAGLQAALPPGDDLQAILLTHAHPDHVGALTALLDFFPDAHLVLHAREAPFLRGKADYVPPGSLLPRLMRAVGVAPSMPLHAPESRLRLLHGSGGSLAEFGCPSLSWLPAPGHSPGHTAYLHTPSGTLLAGDALHLALPSLAWASGLEALLTRPLGWALAPARLAASGVLGGLGAGSSAWLAALSPSRLAGAALARVTGAGPLAMYPLPTPSGSQAILTFKPLRLLPGMALRVSPALFCPQPHCNAAQAMHTLCALASTPGLRRALFVHDATGRGLSGDELAAMADCLPACKG